MSRYLATLVTSHNKSLWDDNSRHTRLLSKKGASKRPGAVAPGNNLQSPISTCWVGAAQASEGLSLHDVNLRSPGEGGSGSPTARSHKRVCHRSRPHRARPYVNRSSSSTSSSPKPLTGIIQAIRKTKTLILTLIDWVFTGSIVRTYGVDCANLRGRLCERPE